MNDPILTVPTKNLSTAGREITLTPIKVKELAAFSRAIEPIVVDLTTGDVIAALARNAEALIEATCIAARVDEDWLGEQSADVLVELASAAMEINAGFFVERILPRIQRVAEMVGTLTQADGSTSL